MSETKQNIFEKMQAVAGELLSIEKDMVVGVGKNAYRAVSDLSVTKRVKELEQKYKLISIPYKQELISSEVVKTAKDGYERIVYSYVIKMVTRFINLEDPNEAVEVESFGHGLDSGDKGFGKASTYARKYALLNAYKIGTGEDPDQTPSEQQTTAKTVGDKLKAISDYLHTDNSKLTSILQQYSVENLEMLDNQQVDNIYNGLKKRRLI